MIVGLLAGQGAPRRRAMTQPTRWRRGRRLALHNDAQDSRVVAFAWHLGWAPGDGGGGFLAEEEGGHLVRPRLETLTLFRTDATTGSAREGSEGARVGARACCAPAPTGTLARLVYSRRSTG